MTILKKPLAAYLATAMILSIPCGLLADEVIARFDGAKTNVNIKGKAVMVVQATIMTTGNRVILAIPNDEQKDKKLPPIPRKELADAVKKLSPGAIVKIDANSSAELGPTLVSIDAYEAKPGEESPNGYIFSKTFEKPGKVPQTSIVVTKFGKEYSFLVPTRKDEKGAQEQDPEILASVEKLQIGGSVWVQAVAGKLVVIEPYTDPKTGKVVKIGDTEIDGKKYPSADVEVDGGKTVTLLVPLRQNGKTFAPDSTVNAELHKVKVNSQVVFIDHEEGSNTWLRDITIAPKVAPEKKAAADKPMKPVKPKKGE